MGKYDVRRKELGRCLRDAKSLCYRTPSIALRRDCKKFIRISNLCLKISRIYDKEFASLKENNINLARAVQHERENYSVLIQEKNSTESYVLELQKENARLRKDFKKLKKTIIAYDEVLKTSMIPNLVALSDDITKFKSKNDDMKRLIESRGNGDILPKNSLNGVNFGSNGSQPISTVSPMVKGCVIQKPTINMNRVTFPSENRASLFANVEIGSPIVEESENDVIELETVTGRNRKCKNGLRHVINSSNAPVPSSIPSNEDKTKPQIRLGDIARKLLNSPNYVEQSGSPSTSEIPLSRRKKSETSGRANDSGIDPLEGCSQRLRQSPSPQPKSTTVVTHADVHQSMTPDRDQINQEESNMNSIKKKKKKKKNSSSAEEAIVERGIFFYSPSSPNSVDATRKESVHPRPSTNVLNESSAYAKENTLLSSTLNSTKKKKFFCQNDESSAFFTARRKLAKSIEIAENLSPEILENSNQRKPAEHSQESCSNNEVRRTDTADVNGNGFERHSKKSRSEKRKKRAESEPMEMLSFVAVDSEFAVDTLEIKLDDCMSGRSGETEETVIKRPSKSRKRVRVLSSSEESDWNDGESVCSHESTASSNSSSRPRRSTRKAQNFSYKEPNLGRKLRR